MTTRWKVRKWRNYGLNATINRWEVFTPEGTWSGTFTTWAEAMEWTRISTRLEHWLENQR